MFSKSPTKTYQGVLLDFIGEQEPDLKDLMAGVSIIGAKTQEEMQG